MMKTVTKRTTPIAAFSLVEVTLAIGITAVALVSLMGMLPRGMQTLQRASDQAIMGRIHQQILGELQLTPWEAKSGGASPLDSFDRSVRIYDDQGIELPDSEKGERTHVYTARISIPKQGSSLPSSVGSASYNGISLPGEAAASDKYARLVIVEITSNAQPAFLDNPQTGFDQLKGPNAVYTYRTLVAKMGQDFAKASQN